MQKQKKGFLLFICSLIPGAGEMYMGFFKQGISIMTLFWAIIAIAGGLNISSLVIFLPVIWFYSFFHVHNLKSLPEEEFYSIEDNYILHLDRVLQGMDKVTPKYIRIVAIFVIIFGVAILWNGCRDLLYWILPGYLGELIENIMYQIPSILIGVLFIIAGYQILTKRPGSTSQPDETQNDFRQWHNWNPANADTAADKATPHTIGSVSKEAENISDDSSNNMEQNKQV